MGIDIEKYELTPQEVDKCRGQTNLLLDEQVAKVLRLQTEERRQESEANKQASMPKKALDIDKLREDIADTIFKSTQRFVGLDVCGECCNFGENECEHESAVGKWEDMKECPQDRLDSNNLAAQILPLIQPLLEQARGEERERIIKSAEIQMPHYSGYGEIVARYLTIKINESEWQALQDKENNEDKSQ